MASLFFCSGWWHVVLNLTEIVAISQNYVSRNNYELFAEELLNDHDNYIFGKKWLTVASKEHPALVKNIDRFMTKERRKKIKNQIILEKY